MSADQLRQFMKQGLGIREVLQAVEDALVDAGYDDFMAVTERGSFHWMTVERARAREAGRRPMSWSRKLRSRCQERTTHP